ncbi:MAG: hypothetical protein ABSD08_14655 [Xanthobacteraceae bacterium]|jgi:hypothetical protein
MSFTSPDESRHASEGVSIVLPATADRIVYWPIINAVGWPVIFVLVWSGPLMLLIVGAPLVLLLWVLSALAALFDAAVQAQARKWRGFLSIIVFPLITLVAALNLGFVWRTGAELGSYIHFYVMRPSYLREISKLPSDEPRLKLFYWRSWLLKSTEVVYDESDEITLPWDTQSEGWTKRAARTDAECRVLGYFSMGGHFYIVTFDC